MDLAARLRELIAKRGIRQSDLAARAGAPEETLSRILTGVTKSPRIDTIQALAGALEVTVSYLLGEKSYEFSATDRSELQRIVAWGEEVLKATEPEKAPALEANASPVGMVRKPPVHARQRGKRFRASATDWRELFGDRLEDEDVEIPDQLAKRGANVVFRAEGESMEGEFIADGDLLYVREEPDPRIVRGKIVVCVVDGSPYVKRLELAGNHVRLISASERHPPMVFDTQTVAWSLVGVVLGWLHEVR
jgi:SOS-response transcriptional repressor LexA